MTIQFLMGPIVGGVIGYFTNWLAIKMLFRPHQPKYFMGLHIPFTPGIIPKEKYRIAESVGKAISENLMNQEVLQKTLLSDEIVQRVHSSLRDFFAGLQNSDESLREFLQRYVSEEDVRKMALSVKNDLGSQVSTHLMTAHLGSEIAHVAVVHVLDKMRLSENIVVRNVEVDDKQGIGDFLKKGFDMLFNKQAKKVFSDVLSALASPVEQLLAKNIDQMMESHAPEMTAKLIDRQTENLLDTSLSELLRGNEEQIDSLCASVVQLYRDVVSKRLPQMLKTLNVSKMIENRINEMDMNEAEHIILDVMDKELKWLVWLGALLGFVIGFANAFAYL